MFCSPGVKNKEYSCFDHSALIRIADKYNEKYPQKKIKYQGINDDGELWELLKNSFMNTCGSNEWCWLDQDFLADDSVIQSYYKPPETATPTTWLSTSDINDALKGFENVFPDFAFMGTVPIDFDQIIEEYSKMDFCGLYNGRGQWLSHGTQIYNRKKIRRFGFVFNLDPHDKAGSHWVAMYMNLSVKKPYIGYFDSYGYCPPPAQMTALMTRLKRAVKECLGLDLIKKCNTIRHQHGRTECGVYSMYFVYQCLIGKSFEEICENIILDDDVNQWRKFFFRPSIKSKQSIFDIKNSKNKLTNDHKKSTNKNL